MIDFTDFDAKYSEDPQEQARLIAQAEAELAQTLQDLNDPQTTVTEL